MANLPRTKKNAVMPAPAQTSPRHRIASYGATSLVFLSPSRGQFMGPSSWGHIFGFCLSAAVGARRLGDNRPRLPLSASAARFCGDLLAVKVAENGLPARGGSL